MQAKGMKSAARIGFEDGFAETLDLSKVLRLPFNSDTMKSAQTLNSAETITGTRNAQEPFTGQKDVSGTMVVPLDARNIGWWLLGLFGPPATMAVDGADGFYQHVFTVKDDSPSFALEKSFPDIGKYEVFTGCKVSKLEISAEVGNNETTASIDFMGKDSFLRTRPLNEAAAMPGIIRFNNTDATVKEDGKVSATARKLDLTIDGGLDGDTYVLNGTASRTDIAEGIMAISGTATMLFTDTEAMRKAVDGIDSSLELVFQKGKYSISFLIPQVKYERTSPEIDGPKGVTLDVNFQAYTDADSAITVTLVNDISSYANVLNPMWLTDDSLMWSSVETQNMWRDTYLQQEELNAAV